MPTYEYHCTGCGFEFEEVQSIAAKSLSKCPKCSARVERKISGGSGLIFKGTGFYITDYKKSGSGTGSPSAKTKPPAKKPAEPKKSDESK
jgi:putative FmdB family regulatory protein